MRFGVYEVFDIKNVNKRLKNRINGILNKYDIKSLK
jgi:hypothetical protein